MNPILIVDDEVEMRIAMSETLKHCGYPVETSHNAIDALNGDSTMFGRSSRSTTSRIRSSPKEFELSMT